MVQKSGSSSVLAEGKPESCGKMLPAGVAGVTAAFLHPADPGVKLPLDVCFKHKEGKDLHAFLSLNYLSNEAD